jgi:glyoxylase I family protein
MLHGSINHVSITVSDLSAAMRFFGPLLEFLGYTLGEIFPDERSGHDLTVNLNLANGSALNIWQAEPRLADRPFEVYEPGLHHVAFNVEKHEQVDAAHEPLRSLGGEILDGPGEFPFGPGGYYAVYFRGPDRLKFEVVHMPLAEQRAISLGLLPSEAPPDEA